MAAAAPQKKNTQIFQVVKNLKTFDIESAKPGILEEVGAAAELYSKPAR